MAHPVQAVHENAIISTTIGGLTLLSFSLASMIRFS